MGLAYYQLPGDCRAALISIELLINNDYYARLF
jgi:flagellar biosynthesis regulator FlaF